MASTRIFQQSFHGGEVSSELFGRKSDVGVANGLAECRNFIVLPHGPVVNRPGTKFVQHGKIDTKRVRLIPFSFSAAQTMVLEFGHQYLRFHTMGATLMLAGVPYEVATPYTDADLFELNYVQSADVMTIVHTGHAPRELRRLGPTSWTLTAINFDPPLLPPTTLTVTGNAPAGGGTGSGGGGGGGRGGGFYQEP